MTILVTGDKGMIGARLVEALLAAGYDVVGLDRTGEETVNGRMRHFQVDLEQADRVKEIVAQTGADRIIHLAALAHAQNGRHWTWEAYYRGNVLCAKNVFEAAGERPVLFISTVDVYGFSRQTVTAASPVCPVSDYAKSKTMAEEACMGLPHYTIFRFSPVYTETEKRDVQKRYYLKYPCLAYRIGKGSFYEILHVQTAVDAMTAWCAKTPENDVHIVKDAVPMWTPDYLRAEREAGRAKLVLYFPRWLVRFSFAVLKGLTGENKYTYLLNKAVYPLRTE